MDDKHYWKPVTYCRFKNGEKMQRFFSGKMFIKGSTHKMPSTIVPVKPVRAFPEISPVRLTYRWSFSYTYKIAEKYF